jgi:hypothetical protein
MAKKTCTKCKVEKPLDEFSQYTEKGVKKHRARCKPCRNDDQKERYKENPDTHRAYLYKAKYGITLEDYDRLLALQNGRCAICPSTEPGGQGRFHIDHNHETGKVRALLCHRCNTGLGLFSDNPEILIKAAQYLYTNGHYGTT